MTDRPGVNDTVPIGIHLTPCAPVGRLADLAAHAEALGCTRCWVHDEGLPGRDVFVALAAVADATEHIRLGPGITNPYVRHPGVTAAAIATIDEMSGGRAFLGLGAGGHHTLGPLGIERRRPLTAVSDTIDAVRGLLAGELVDHRGPTFALSGASLPYGRAGLEIILAGRGPKMRALAGAKADGFSVSHVHKELLDDTIRAVRRLPEAEGRPFSIVYSAPIATTDDEFEQTRARLGSVLAAAPAEVGQRVGLSPDHTHRLRAALADGGPAAAAELVDPEWVPDFAITGTPAECSAELRRLMRRHGIDEFQLAVTDIDRGAELIERAAALLRRA